MLLYIPIKSGTDHYSETQVKMLNTIENFYRMIKGILNKVITILLHN